MKKQILIYGAAIGILDVVIFLAFLYGTATDFSNVSFAVALFIPFVAYIYLETYLCDRFEMKQIVFAVCVMGVSFISLLCILFLTALTARNLLLLEGVGRVGMFVLYAYAGMVGLRLLWQLFRQLLQKF